MKVVILVLPVQVVSIANSDFLLYQDQPVAPERADICSNAPKLN